MDADAGADLAVGLFERYQVEIFTYLCRMVHDREWAQDLAQETFLKTLQARRQLAQIGNHRAWLYRVATNLALNALKRRRRFTWLPWEAADRAPAGKPDLAEALDRRSLVDGALAALPPHYRATLLLYARDGLSTAEVAKALGLSEAAARQRLCRARELFRQAYAKGGAR